MDTFTSYNDARAHIKSGDIIFIKGDQRDWLSRLIMWSTNSKFSHVGIAVWLHELGYNDDRLMIIESQGGTRRRLINMSFYQDAGFVVMDSSSMWSKVRDEAINTLGLIEYGYLDALWVGIRERTQIMFNVMLPPLNFNGETCSEFIARLCGLQDPVVSPQRLHDQIIELGINQKIDVVLNTKTG